MADELDALGYLQAVYQGKIIAEPPRMKAAIEALPFERPRLSATMVAKDFGKQIETVMRAKGKSDIVGVTTVPVADRH
jgi:hypothetical protein